MLLLREADVRALCSMDDVVRWLEEATVRQHRGATRMEFRSRVRLPGGTFNVLPAADLELGVAGVKTYLAVAGSVRFVLLLFSLKSGALLAIMEADALGVLRTGAVSGLASRYMAAGQGRHRLGVIGTGSQARGQVAGVVAACPVDEVRVFGRRRDPRAELANWVEAELGVPCLAAGSAREAVDGASIVCTITNSSTPVIASDDIAPGTHINAAGANSLVRRELPDELIQRARTVAVDSRAQAQMECGDLLGSWQRGQLVIDELPDLSDVVGGSVAVRHEPSDVTIFESQGLGLHDVVVGAHIYRRACAAGLGERVPFLEGA
jgi:ornithine cyclodeaminase/alanine dehydrogenase-like protein (mu-crystallin family)